MSTVPGEHWTTQLKLNKTSIVTTDSALFPFISLSEHSQYNNLNQQGEKQKVKTDT